MSASGGGGAQVVLLNRRPVQAPVSVAEQRPACCTAEDDSLPGRGRRQRAAGRCLASRARSPGSRPVAAAAASRHARPAASRGCDPGRAGGGDCRGPAPSGLPSAPRPPLPARRHSGPLCSWPHPLGPSETVSDPLPAGGHGGRGRRRRGRPGTRRRARAEGRRGRPCWPRREPRRPRPRGPASRVHNVHISARPTPKLSGNRLAAAHQKRARRGRPA